MRMVVLLTLAMLIVVMTTAFNLKSQQVEAHQKCVTAQTNAQNARGLLEKIVVAANKDGDKNMADFWQNYLNKVNAAPPTKC